MAPLLLLMRTWQIVFASVWYLNLDYVAGYGIVDDGKFAVERNSVCVDCVVVVGIGIGFGTDVDFDLWLYKFSVDSEG